MEVCRFYCNPNNGIELPIYTYNKKYLERAKEYLQVIGLTKDEVNKAIEDVEQLEIALTT